jgi:hypothetical protein
LWNALAPLKLTIISFRDKINKNLNPKMPAIITPLGGMVFSSSFIPKPNEIIKETVHYFRSSPKFWVMVIKLREFGGGTG